MKIIKNENELNYYIEKFNIDSIFEKDMRKYMKLFYFNKGEMICKADEDFNYFYFLVKGKVKIFILMENGKRLLLRFYKPLEIIGDVEALDLNKADCNVEALTETLLIGINFNDIRKYAYDDSKFLRYMCKNLRHKVVTCSNSNAINLLYALENRLASYLLAVSCDEYNDAKYVEEIKTNKLTEMADLLGTSYRHLNRVINDLCKREIIKKENNCITIIDREKLQELAGDIYE